MHATSTSTIEHVLRSREALSEAADALRAYHLNATSPQLLEWSTVDLAYMAISRAVERLDSIGRLCCFCGTLVPSGQEEEANVEGFVAHPVCADIDGEAALNGALPLPGFVYRFVAKFAR